MGDWDFNKPNETPWVSDTYQEYEKWPLVPGKVIPVPDVKPGKVPKDVIDALKEFQKAMEKQNEKPSKKAKPKAKPKKKKKLKKQQFAPAPPTHDEQNEEREI